MESTLNCLNCNKPVSVPGEGKLFAGVFVCPECNEVGERILERATKELKLVLVMMKDAIRSAMLRKQLQFKTPEQLRSMKKADYLSELGRLIDEMQEREWKTHSSETSKPPAPSADGNES